MSPGWLAVGGAFVLGVGMALVYASGAAVDPASERIESVAVLPFDDFSPERDLAFLGEGIAEEVLNALARLGTVRVPSRSASFRLRESGLSPREIGSRLGVQAVLEGGIRREGDRVRATAQLIDSGSGFQIWSEAFEGESRDLFGLQEEIARGVVSALGVTGGPGSGSRLVEHGTDDAEAYELWLRGRALWSRRTAESVRLSAEYFERAVERDSSYAAAYAGLADAKAVQVVLMGEGTEGAEDLLESARELVERALELDPALGEAWASLGFLQGFAVGGWRDGMLSLRLAVALSPGYPWGHLWLANSLVHGTGDLEQALVHFERAYDLDPLTSLMATNLGTVLYYVGRVDRAIEVLEANVRANPDAAETHRDLAQVLVSAGRHVDAVQAANRAVELASGSGWSLVNPAEALVNLAEVLARAGEPARAREVAEQALEAGAPAYRIGLVHYARGEIDLAFDWLRRGGWGYFSRRRLEFDPALAGLRADPRFEELFAELKREQDSI